MNDLWQKNLQIFILIDANKSNGENFNKFDGVTIPQAQDQK